MKYIVSDKNIKKVCEKILEFSKGKELVCRLGEIYDQKEFESVFNIKTTKKPDIKMTHSVYNFLDHYVVNKADIITVMDLLPNKQKYIKELIRADLKNKKILKSHLE